MISAILLAAGAGRRFGADSKLLQDLDGKQVIRWSVDAFRHPWVADVVVVVPPEHDAIRRALEGCGARLVVNPDPAAGMGRSLAVGVASLGLATDAALVVPGDTPRIGRGAIDRVLARFSKGDAQIVVPSYRGTRGHPVLFSRAIFPELTALDGDAGARSVTDRDAGRVAFVDCDENPPSDVDTVEDLARLRLGAHHTPSSIT